MLRHQGGERVNAGFYLNVDRWAVTTLSGRGGQLGGTSDTRYLRVPTILVLLCAPLMGAAYVVFLPFAGIAMVLHYLGRKGYVGARGAAEATLMAMGPSWRPGEAHFAGRPDEKRGQPAEGEPKAGERLDKIDEEISKREETAR